METKEKRLRSFLRKQGKVAIAFSGGIDSTYLANIAKKVLGRENVLAVIVNSELFTDEEFESAKKTAKLLDIQFKSTSMHELKILDIANNKPNTWYKSKKLLYATIKRIARENRFDVVDDGMIMDDLSDFRPGIVAKKEAGVISPLIETNFYKDDIRYYAKKEGMTIWNKVASCSLCSRFPYHSKITLEKIKQVISGEKFFRNLGYRLVRVRHHGETARIEVSPEKIADVIKDRKKINNYFEKLGFLYVAIDLAGYQEGKMNKDLTESEKKLSVRE
ncbi:MAG: ATP-dependent sacrificial sulfur transferase LarE [Sporolactobacillus sp.]|jgi:uncharacterized protein|nr:ATP-dependent sacrificial sulfur transferase LarE [Sporolactobacillus sp.]